MSARGQKPDGQMKPSEMKSTAIKQQLAESYQQASMRINQSGLLWLVFDPAVTRQRTLRSDRSVCHSGIKFRRAVRRVQAESLVEFQCEKEGTRREEGCGA